MTSTHPFDLAIALQNSGQESGNNDNFNGHISAAYGNMVGPYGGAISAVMLNAVLSHAERRGDPASLTVNFAAPINDADFQVSATLMRNTRSTQHWNMTLSQQGEVAITASCLLANRRDSWSDNERKAPSAPTPDSLTAASNPVPAWVANYEMRFVNGEVTLDPADKSDHSSSLLWVRDQPQRPLDFLSLTAISDCFFPRVFVRTQQLVPAGTVTLTTYFHASAETLAKQGTDYLLAESHANRFNNGFFDQSGYFWGSDGELLISTHQLVYFKG